MRKRFEALWAIRPEAIPTVARLIARDMGVATPMGADSTRVQAVSTQWAAAASSVQGSGRNKVAIIPIQGVLTNDGPPSYGSNYQGIAAAAERAAADPEVARIVLAVDSPGGEVTGLPETAAVLRRVAQVKPVSAMVDGAAASAAYWLTSQASDITLTPSGEVGSVGVKMLHVDMSQMLENEGYKITELSSGDFKTEWSPYQPLTDAAKAVMQTKLDSTHAQFLSDIGSGRGSRASQTMRSTRFGEGRMHTASDALAGGLVDRIQPSRDFYAGVARSTSGTVAGRMKARLDLERLKA